MYKMPSRTKGKKSNPRHRCQMWTHKKLFIHSWWFTSSFRVLTLIIWLIATKEGKYRWTTNRRVKLTILSAKISLQIATIPTKRHFNNKCLKEETGYQKLNSSNSIKIATNITEINKTQDSLTIQRNPIEISKELSMLTNNKSMWMNNSLRSSQMTQARAGLNKCRRMYLTNLMHRPNRVLLNRNNKHKTNNKMHSIEGESNRPIHTLMQALLVIITRTTTLSSTSIKSINWNRSNYNSNNSLINNCKSQVGVHGGRQIMEIQMSYQKDNPATKATRTTTNRINIITIKSNHGKSLRNHKTASETCKVMKIIQMQILRTKIWEINW